MAQQFRCSQWPKLSAAQPQRTKLFGLWLSICCAAWRHFALATAMLSCLAKRTSFCNGQTLHQRRGPVKKKNTNRKNEAVLSLPNRKSELHFFPELRCSKLFLSPLRALKTSGMFNPSPVDRPNKTQPRPCAEHCNTRLDAVGPGADVEPGVAGQ